MGNPIFKLGMSLTDRLAQVRSMTVETLTGCHVLVGWKSHKHGYPAIGCRGGSKAIARCILIEKGIDMDGKDTRHTCDNKECINPNHIISGTRADNGHDARMRRPKVKSGRNTYSVLKGATRSRGVKKWRAKATILGKDYYLGCFDTEVDAHAAYNTVIRAYDETGVLPALKSKKTF